MSTAHPHRSNARAIRTKGACALVALLAAGAVAGCGVRGNLEPPPEAKAAGQATTPDAADSAGSKSEPKPHRPFILDGLIR